MLGESTGCLNDWLARGRAQPDVEPYGSWCREFLAAERAAEAICTELQSQTVAVIARKPPHMRTLAEISWVDRLLATRYPREHGNASAGTGNARVAEPEPDGEAWWQKNGLQSDQLRALFKDPPDAVALAQLAEGNAIVLRLLRDGWVPDDEVRFALSKGKHDEDKSQQDPNQGKRRRRKEKD